MHDLAMKEWLELCCLAIRKENQQKWTLKAAFVKMCQLLIWAQGMQANYGCLRLASVLGLKAYR